MSEKPIMTRHALQRSKERIGLDKRAAARLAAIALVRGITREEARGYLKYVFELALYKSRGGNEVDTIRVYAEKVFLFHKTTLVTVLPLANECKAMARKILQRKAEEEGRR